MKTLTSYIKESEDLNEPSNWYRECYFDWNGEEDALEALDAALSKTDKMCAPRAGGDIDETPDKEEAVLFSIWGLKEADVDKYADLLLQNINPRYADMVDTFSGENIANE